MSRVDYGRFTCVNLLLKFSLKQYLRCLDFTGMVHVCNDRSFNEKLNYENTGYDRRNIVVFDH
jgi:hypothetical protein